MQVCLNVESHVQRLSVLRVGLLALADNRWLQCSSYRYRTILTAN